MSNIKKSVNFFFRDLMVLVVIFKIAPINISMLCLILSRKLAYVWLLNLLAKNTFYLFCNLVNGSFSAKKLCGRKADAEIH